MNGLYINLKERTDRKKHFENLKKKYDFFKNINRFEAILPPPCPLAQSPGLVGCCMSSIECMKKLSTSTDKYVGLFEDDFVIFPRCHTHFENFIKDFQKIKDKDWDIIVLTPRGDMISTDTSLKEYGFLRIKNHQTTTGFIVKPSFLKILIPHLIYGLNMMLKGGNTDLYAGDQVWKPLQEKYKFYYYHKLIAGHLPGYSSIEKKNVNYNQRFARQFLNYK